MRRIVSCPACELQYDATARPVGSRFHCVCSEVVEVVAERGHDASVVRCSSCGAPRSHGSHGCAHCGSDYTLHERDLHTVCPKCTARISDRARFCHHCGTAIHAEWNAGEATELGCPVCGDGVRLVSRRLDTDITSLECQGCAGLWLGHDAVSQYVERAEVKASRAAFHGRASQRHPLVASRRRQPGPTYRQCIRCGKHMNRTNYGRRSGVIVDTCKDHGVWFDADELKLIVEWVRDGGLDFSRKRERMRTAEERARPRPRPVDWNSLLAGSFQVF